MAGTTPITPQQQGDLLRAISEIQSGYIAGERDAQDMANRLLDILLDLTGSQFGFLGELLDPQSPDEPWLRTWAMTDISWDDASRARYKAFGIDGVMEFQSRNNLFARVLDSPDAVISNNPQTDSRAGGAPKGHPHLKSFMGLPMSFGGERVGMAAMANREGGYDEEVAAFLEPLLTTMASMIIAKRQETARLQAEAAVQSSQNRYQLAVAGIGAGIWEWDTVTKTPYWSDRMRTIVGAAQDDPVPTPDSMRNAIHPDDRDRFVNAYEAHLKTGTPLQERIRLKRFDEGWATVDTHGQAEWDEHGKPLRIVGSVVDVTEVIEAEARAVKAGLTAEVAIQSADMGRWQYSGDTGIISMDLRFARMIGREELLDSGFTIDGMLALTAEDDKPEMRASIDRAFNEPEGRLSFSHRLACPDGGWIWLHTEGAVTRRGDDGRILEMAGIVADHTHLRQVEQEATELRRMYELAIAGSELVVFDFDLHSGRTFASPQYYELLGMKVKTSGDFDGFLERLHPDDAPRVMESMANLDRIHGTEVLTYRLRREDGTYAWIESNGNVIRDEDGHAIRVSGTLRDITERKRIEAKARQAAARAQMALAISGLGVWELEVGSSDVQIDPALARLIGETDRANPTLTIEELYARTHPDDLPRVQPDLHALVAGDRDHVMSEHRIFGADGEEIWIKAHVSVIDRKPDGTPDRIIGIVDDLREQKAGEALLKQAARAAEAASSAKSMFLANMSHEIRTPLNGVLGIAQLLALTELEDRQKAYVETIKSSGRALLAIIEDILDLSKIEAGKLSLNLEVQDLTTVLTDTVDSHRPSAEQKGLNLTLQMSDDLPGPVEMDATRVRQVLSNLVGNAIKFTETGKVAVSATLARPGRVRFEVKDTGPGIAPAHRAQIFDRFQQADMSHSRSHEGAGLGLAIAHELVSLMSGQIGVESELGRGACFWFELDLQPARLSQLTGPDLIETMRLKAPASAGRVLVVDDQTVNREVTAEMVRQIGFMPVMASDGAEALDLLRKHSFEAILMDLHMPGMSGDEAISRIRTGEVGQSDVPIFVVTADVTTQTRDRIKLLKTDGFLGKPLELNGLRAALQGLHTGAA